MSKLKFASIILIVLISSPAVSAVTKTKGPAVSQNETSAARQFSAESPISSGDVISITIVASQLDEGKAHAAMSQALSRAERLDREIFSPDGIDSQISNLKPGETLTLSDDAFDMIGTAVQLSASTNGWYDVAAPSEKGLFVQRDWRRIVLDKNTRTIAFKSDGMRLDLRRIETGYIVDIVMNELAKAGFSNARVALGPVERIAGRDIFTPWNVQIDFGGGSEYAHRAYNYNLTDVSAATVTQDRLGSGLIDAHSRKPAAPGALKSVTVLAQNAATATAYALAAYTLGPKVGLRFVESHPETQGIFVDNSGALIASKGFRTTAAAATQPSFEQAADRGPNDMKQKQREEENEDR